MAEDLNLPVSSEENDELSNLNVLSAVAIGANKNDPCFLWTPRCIRLLLSLYKKHEAEFKSGVIKHNKIWKTVASLMQQNGYKISWGKCQSKLNGLKKTYKKVIDHNSKSRNDRATWPYFTVMNDLFGKTSWAQTLSSEAESSSPFKFSQPQVQPLSSSFVREEPQAPKKRKLETIIEKYNGDLEVCIFSIKKRGMNKQEEHKIKIKKIEEIMAQKERQHEKKMKFTNALLEAISKNK